MDSLSARGWIAYRIGMSLDITPSEELLGSDDAAGGAGLADRTLWIMAGACGIAAANIYYNQPLLEKFAAAFDVSAAQAGLVATAAQVGYGVGIFFFCPLGDLIERRRLVLLLMGACCLLLVGMAMAKFFWLLVVFQLLVGITAMSAQVLIPLAIDLSPPARRGHTVGILMAGLLMGILLARTVAGFVGDAFGWQSVYVMAATGSAGMAVLLWVSLPHRAPTLRVSYPRLMHSLIELLATQPQLWVSSMVSGLSFAGFTAFWTTLVFLMKDHFHRGASEAGMFGIIGVAGALAAPVAGKVSDRWGPRVAITAALVASGLAFALMGFWVSIAGLILGVLLMDMGVQSIQVAEQSTVMALLPQSRSRINTLYMVGRFMGGAVGSALGAVAWSRFGWTGVCGLCVMLMMIAMAIHLIGRNLIAASRGYANAEESPRGVLAE
jgi:predicted MFS family arabinose efflux permease